jgi:magnesium-transporting ATPase (P-type)
VRAACLVDLFLFVSLNGFFCFQICYFFYKNIAFGLTLFYFEAFTAFSGQSVYNDWYMLLFNVILTSLPVISLGVFEQDVSSEVCLQVCPINHLAIFMQLSPFTSYLSAMIIMLFLHSAVPSIVSARA